MYTIKDTGNRETATSFAQAVQIIEQWYQDYAEWSTGSATADENQTVWDAIDSVDQPEFGGDLQDYADQICQSIATAVGGTDFHGHGNYSVSAADQMGLSLTVEAADEEIADGFYFIQPEGGSWDVVMFGEGEVMCMSSESDYMTHVSAGDVWAGLEPCEDDVEVEGDEAYTIVRKYAAFIGRDIDADCVVVSHPGWVEEEDDDIFEGDNFTLSITEGTEVVNDYRFDEPAIPRHGCIKLECPLGTAVYESFEQLVEDHPVCSEAADWYVNNSINGRVCESDYKPILTHDMVRELCIATTRNEAGQHFTQFMEHFLKLEHLNLVKINRPVHDKTQMPFSFENWTIEVTEWGQTVIAANPELHPCDDETETTVCGHAVQYDKSGVGHCWVSIDRSEIPASIVEEIEGEMIDGGKDSCDSFRASNGIHYRW